MVPAAAEQPAIPRQFLIKLTQQLAEFCLVLGILEWDFRKPLPRAEQMHMAVVEAGHHAPTLQIEDTRLRPDPGPDVVGTAHGEKAITQHRQGLSLGLRAVDSPDPGVDHDKVGGAAGRRGGLRGENGQAENSDQKEQVEHDAKLRVGVIERRIYLIQRWNASRRLASPEFRLILPPFRPTMQGNVSGSSINKDTTMQTS